MRITRIVVASLLSLAAFAAHAQQLKVATGGPQGTYSQMFKEVARVCQGQMNLVEQNTSGSVENVDLLVSNKINAAIVQSDVLKFRARNEAQISQQVRTVFGLHPEEIHLVTRADGRKVGGYGFGNFKFGAELVVLRDFRDMEGKVAGAVGGSYLTAQVLANNSGISFNVEQFGSNDDMLRALAEGKIDVAVMVMGAPAKAITEMGPEFRLLPIEGKQVEALKDYYDVTRLTYNNLSDSQGVAALSVQALFVSRNYKTDAMKNGLNTLRECVSTKLDELKEEMGTHPKWQQVEAGQNGKWLVYNNGN
ncbi:transporter substrate-binding domain-containing protein [Achromobacter phage Motura]|uniref:Transporter substrate-binding domain-containing protein n=1 Tax=Achromobacter phage Motura TaxID=2591403 RepID=A0A514CT84_9CAUD|nr:transporter substrate-binding domain-containing protein [Achromobacter phage Motura]QDH83685.1 transporter substrate-binding domain-containing protein [Achromobacter phage Motura]